MSAFVMVISAAAIVLAVKFGLLRGIDHVANAMNWSAKARGQVTGYATSVPEFVCLVSAGLAGVWEAGLWNIASSNIINAVLMFLAVVRYRQFGELFNLRFVDEVGFAALAIAVPIGLMQWNLDTEWLLVPLLLGFFVVYQVVDKRINRPPKQEQLDAAVGNLPFGLILGLTAGRDHRGWNLLGRRNFEGYRANGHSTHDRRLDSRCRHQHSRNSFLFCRVRRIAS